MENNFISLCGKWNFELDKMDLGEKEQWYNRKLKDSINLPGTLQLQGFGNKISKNTPFIDGLHDNLWFLREEYREFAEDTDTKVPFLSQLIRHYTGVAWYQKEIYIPDEWEQKYIILILELVRWKTNVWIDDVYCGNYDSLCVAHKYQLGKLKSGKHILTIKVDNSMIFPYRPDAHGVSDSVGHSWNGIAGKIELMAENSVQIDNISVYPDYLTKSARVNLNIKNIEKINQNLKLNVKKTININFSQICDETEESFDINISKDEEIFEFNLNLGENAGLWDEFEPILHKLEFLLSSGTEISDKKEVTFGLRNIETKGRKFVLNGRNICFRGTHDAGCFPLTGYPATDVNEWKRIMNICKEWGLNHIRFHSWCPPEQAFIAADELGIYLQIETGMWNYFIQGGEIEKQLYIETDRILKAYGNHASFVLMSSGNEPHGDYKPIMKQWVEKYRKQDNRRLYCGQSGWLWPAVPEELNFTDYLYTCSRYGTSKMRGREGWFGKNYSSYMEDLEIPFICHELGQYCSYPDFSIIDKFTGYLQAGNYEIFKNIAKKHNILHKNEDFVKASGILQVLAYKEEIEANLRTPEFSGFSLLDLHDYLGQGSALVGILDAFWQEKPYSNAKQFKRFCTDTVPIARLEKVVYKSDEKLETDVEIACYSKNDLINSSVYWKIKDEFGEVWKEGFFEKTDIKTGGNTEIGKISVDLSDLKIPLSYRLVIGVENTEIENDWKIWIYPATINFSDFKEVKITEKFNDAMSMLKKGEKVLFLPKPEDISYNSPTLSTLPVFWNGHMGPKWSRGLGLYCNTNHMALSEFPTDIGMEWQWSEIVETARGLNIEKLPKEIEPFIWPIDDWNRSYKLAMAFEAKVGKGKLIVCSADLKNNLENRPAARQLLYSIVKYMESSSFNPNIEVKEKDLKTFMFNTTIMKDLNVKVKLLGSSENEYTSKFPIENIIDCNPNTYWLAGGKDGGKYPFEIELETEKVVEIKGLYVMPRQNHRDAEGAVKKYEIYFSSDGYQWEKICEGEFKASFDLQEIYFEKNVKIKRLRIKLIEGFGAENVYYWVRDKGFHMKYGEYKDKFAALAEIAFICTDNNDFSISEDVKIVYEDVGTASEEIY